MRRVIVNHDAMWTPSSPVYRRLGLRDHERYRQHLLALAPNHRRLRFHGPMSDRCIDEHVAKLDAQRTLLIGVFLGGELHGAAEIAFVSREDRSSAELAVSVESAFQRRGWGRGLTERGLRIARNRGARLVWMYCLPENEPMRRIARALEGQLQLQHAAIDARVPLEPATLGTRLDELTGWQSLRARQLSIPSFAQLGYQAVAARAVGALDRLRGRARRSRRSRRASGAPG